MAPFGVERHIGVDPERPVFPLLHTVELHVVPVPHAVPLQLRAVSGPNLRGQDRGWGGGQGIGLGLESP